jgi:hypothetical protein
MTVSEKLAGYDSVGDWLAENLNDRLKQFVFDNELLKMKSYCTVVRFLFLHQYTGSLK